ncbi:MAG: hypothetical protein ABIK10_04240 [candidate division WOR-3 bacterium]
MILVLIIAATISPAAYFTLGHGGYSSYTFSGYLTIAEQTEYLFWGYEHYREESFRQNLFSTGLGRTLFNKVFFRTTLLGYENNLENFGLVVATRAYYGYNPWYTLGYFYTIYTQNLATGPKTYWITHLVPEFHYSFQRIKYSPHVSFGLGYTKNLESNYLLGKATLGLNILKSLLVEFSGFYGKAYHFIDDQKIIVCNRADIQKAKFNITLKYALFSKISLVGAITRDIFSSYNINYATLGISYQSNK